jgi:tetratricopeptide (TPR) repeat protein
MHVYGTRDLQRLLGIGPSSVRSFIRAGHVRPRKGARGRLQFTFQDLIILRTARTLSGANVPTRRLNRCLRELRKALPADIPLSGLSITAIGDQVAVREGRQHWDTESRQYLLALDVSIESGEVQVIAREAPVVVDDGSSHYDRAYALEDEDPHAAITAYLRCIDADADHLEARTNCGRLLHIAGRLAEAEKIYRGATEPDGTLLFNLAVLLEDSGREAEALQVYAQALEMDPGLADAHFNLARLHERAGNRRESFRHLLAYKRASDNLARP